MTARVALLRGVNVGGKTMVPMATLKRLAEDLGWEKPSTLLQSGNLVFAAAGEAANLEAALEAAVFKACDYRAEVFVRNAMAWADAIAANPFKDVAKADPSHLLLLTLKAPPLAGALEDLRAAVKGPEAVEVRGREAYVTYPDGIGRSKLTIPVIERRLGCAATGRNWNTVLKLENALHDLG